MAFEHSRNGTVLTGSSGVSSRGAVFLLNLPPDRRGAIHENDVRWLREFHQLLDATFSTDFARGARVSAT